MLTSAIGHAIRRRKLIIVNGVGWIIGLTGIRTRHHVLRRWNLVVVERRILRLLILLGHRRHTGLWRTSYVHVGHLLIELEGKICLCNWQFVWRKDSRYSMANPVEAAGDKSLFVDSWSLLR